MSTSHLLPWSCVVEEIVIRMLCSGYSKVLSGCLFGSKVMQSKAGGEKNGERPMHQPKT